MDFNEIDFMSSLLEQLGLPLYVIGEDQQVVYANSLACTLFGKSPDDAPFAITDYITEYEQVRFRQAFELVLSKGVWAGEISYELEAGVLHFFDSKWFLLRGVVGGPYIGILNVDSSDKKQLQSQLLRLQRMDSVGNISSGVVHDLNNLFSVFLMGTRVLRQRASEPQVLGVLDMLEKAVRRGMTLVGQILSFVKGDIEHSFREVSVGLLVDEVVNLIRHSLRENVDLQIDIGPDLWLFQGNVVQIHQVLLNLCANARDAVNDTGGVVRIDAENVELDDILASELGTLKPGKYVKLSVVDTGAGIPEEIQQRIFEPFFSTKQAGKGTGLGLSTVQFIVRNHGGHLVLHSVLDQGTSFELYFPVVHLG